MEIYTTYREVSKAIDELQGDWAEWIPEAIGKNLGTRQAVITGWYIRRKTDEEKAQHQRDMIGLIEADLNSRTPLFGGRS